jgi:hypothetical protein
MGAYMYVGECLTYNYAIVRNGGETEISDWDSDTVTWSVIDADGANNGRK